MQQGVLSGDRNQLGDVMSAQSPNTVREEMERIYRETPPPEIPWNIESPPKILVDLSDHR
jgi:hypothetical protein